MSEYQYYEFQAIDTPLTEKQVDTLRSISSRAVITPTSFTNHYNYGDFKGDPRKLMRKFFDAHVYVANWGSAELHLRIPLEFLDPEIAKRMEGVQGLYVFDIDRTKTHWILRWDLGECEDWEQFELEDGEGWMGRLRPIRDEIMRGDLRSLYIAWLAGISRDLLDVEAEEPFPATGMGALTRAQRDLAGFISVDPDLLAGVGIGFENAGGDDQAGVVEEWLNSLSREQLREMVRALANGQAAKAELRVRSELLQVRKARQQEAGETRLRTVADLRTAAEKGKRLRQRRAEQVRQKKLAREREARKKYLASLAEDFLKAWGKAHLHAERGSGKGYDEACAMIKDLQEAYGVYASNGEFVQKLNDFMQTHAKRRKLVERLVRGGIWKEGR